MEWRNLYPRLNRLTSFPGYFLICLNCASATIGILYLQDPFKEFFQYLPGLAAILYFVNRLAGIAYYKLKVSKNEIIGYLFILSTGVSLVGQSALGMDANDQNNVSSWSFTFAAWTYNVMYFFAGAACTQIKYEKSNILAIVFVLLVVIPLLNTLDGGLFVDYYKLKQITGDQNLSHLYISEWCVFLFISAYAFANRVFRPFVIIIALVCLFSLQGRSSTIFTFVAIVTFSFFVEGRKIFYTAIICIVIGIAAYFFLPIQDVLVEARGEAFDRMVLSGGEEDNSLTARSDILWFSIGHLPQSVLFGDPTFIALEARKMGSYIHNLLSMWQFFGLLPFLLIVVILIRSLLSLKSRIKQGGLTVMEEIAGMLLIYVTVSVVLSKSIIFYWLWFATGYWMLRYADAIQSSKRRRSSRSGRKKRRRKKSMSF